MPILYTYAVIKKAWFTLPPCYLFATDKHSSTMNYCSASKLVLVKKLLTTQNIKLRKRFTAGSTNFVIQGVIVHMYDSLASCLTEVATGLCIGVFWGWHIDSRQCWHHCLFLQQPPRERVSLPPEVIIICCQDCPCVYCITKILLSSSHPPDATAVALLLSSTYTLALLPVIDLWKPTCKIKHPFCLLKVSLYTIQQQHY